MIVSEDRTGTGTSTDSDTEAPTQLALELRDVSKSYPSNGFGQSTEHARGFPGANGHRTHALQGISLELKRGEVLSLLGPSGCGKSTALRLVAGLETPDRGEIWLNGRLVASAGGRAWVPPEKRRIGLVFQDYALFPHMTVGKNIAFAVSGWPSAKQKARVRDLLQLVGLEDLEGRYPHQLSGGQQQRVALARAVALEPDIVLLDEPFSSLDEEKRATMRDQVYSILKALNSTVVFVTHDQEEALLLGDRVAVMNAGRIEQVGTPEDIFQHPANRFVADFLGISCFLPAIVTPRGLQTELGFNPQSADVPAGTAVQVLVRPDDLTLYRDPEGEGRVIRCIFRGMDYLYDVALPSGRVIQCFGEHTVRHDLGTSVRVELTAGHSLTCFPDDVWPNGV
jgi:iron(III) transport system ATP-binding protein